MDYKKEYLNNFYSNKFKHLLKLETLKKIITKPWKIPTGLYNTYKDIKIINSDVKLKSNSTEYDLNVVNASIVALSKLSANHRETNKKIKKINEVFDESAMAHHDCEELANLFKKHGSDKSTNHNYYIAYASLLKNKKDNSINILEIGLGTNNIDIMSNMGTFGTPGASLRAFRDMYKNASVFGADVDKRILFSEERIKTFYVDQTNPATFNDLKDNLSGLQFDLIIDDGLHNSQANLNTTNFALDLLKPDGVFVIEDISSSDFQYYQIVEAILKDKLSVDFIETKGEACICIFKKK